MQAHALHVYPLAFCHHHSSARRAFCNVFSDGFCMQQHILLPCNAVMALILRPQQRRGNTVKGRNRAPIFSCLERNVKATQSLLANSSLYNAYYHYSLYYTSIYIRIMWSLAIITLCSCEVLVNKSSSSFTVSRYNLFISSWKVFLWLRL